VRGPADARGADAARARRTIGLRHARAGAALRIADPSVMALIRRGAERVSKRWPIAARRGVARRRAPAGSGASHGDVLGSGAPSGVVRSARTGAIPGRRHTSPVARRFSPAVAVRVAAQERLARRGVERAARVAACKVKPSTEAQSGLSYESALGASGESPRSHCGPAGGSRPDTADAASAASGG
jgi:hypothetical protein